MEKPPRSPSISASFLKLIVLCAALLTVVDLTMAGGADSTDPEGVVRSAIGKAACVMRL